MIAESLYSNSTDLDDDDHDDRQATIHFSLLTKEDMIESNEDFNLLKNKNKQITTASLPESSNDIIDLIREDLYKFVFMPISQQFSSYVRCRVIRNKSGSLQTFRLEVECENDGKSVYIFKLHFFNRKKWNFFFQYLALAFNSRKTIRSNSI